MLFIYLEMGSRIIIDILFGKQKEKENITCCVAKIISTYYCISIDVRILSQRQIQMEMKL